MLLKLSDEDRQNHGCIYILQITKWYESRCYTFKSEDDLDAGEEYSRNGVEVQYTIASGLTAYVNIDDYDYKEGTSDGTTSAHINDSGTNFKTYN